MALADIISKILKDAESKALTIKSDANMGAADILKEAEEKGAAVYSGLIDRAREKADLEKKRSQVNREISYKKEILSRKQFLIDEAFKTAMGRLEGLDDRGYLSLIKSMLLGSGAQNYECIVISKKDENRITGDFIKSLGDKSHGRLKIKVDDKFKGGGFILEGKTARVNLGFASVLEDLKEEIAGDVADILFKAR